MEITSSKPVQCDSEYEKLIVQSDPRNIILHALFLIPW